MRILLALIHTTRGQRRAVRELYRLHETVQLVYLSEA